MEPPPSPVLVVEGLSKAFGKVDALRDLTCALRPGEVVGVLGPNGAGKTTTLKLLLGMLRPSAGRATLLGLDCTRDAQRVRAVLLAARLGLTGGVGDDDGRLDLLTGGYSHGMKKKLALLLALVHAPPVLLLDEPTNGLDPPSAARVRELLREQATGGAAVLVSTHLLDMADRLCDRVLVLHLGRLLLDGTPAEMRRAAQVPPDAPLEAAFLPLVERAP
ncbi:MAG: ATP-binding cassette domain-containing protein [Polyangiaceae bacterium]|nr:ATP-binding cassette domain-containing protein [Polyangiaceae bacterium]